MPTIYEDQKPEFLEFLRRDPFPRPTLKPDFNEFKIKMQRFCVMLDQSILTGNQFFENNFKHLHLKATDFKKICDYILRLDLETCLTDPNSGTLLRSYRIEKGSEVSRTIDICILDGQIFTVIMKNNKSSEHTKPPEKQRVRNKGAFKIHKPEFMFHLSNINPDDGMVNFIAENISRSRFSFRDDDPDDINNPYRNEDKVVTALRAAKLMIEFANEFNIANKISHKNILPLFISSIFSKKNAPTINVYSKNGIGSLITASGHIIDFIDKNPNNAQYIIYKLVKDMITSVDLLHRYNIISRDIKLDNFILMPYGEDLYVALTDFGAALDLNSIAYLQEQFLTRIGFNSNMQIEHGLIPSIAKMSLILGLCPDNCRVINTTPSGNVISIAHIINQVKLIIAQHKYSATIMNFCSSLLPEQALAGGGRVASPQIFHAHLGKKTPFTKYYSKPEMANVRGRIQYLRTKDELAYADCYQNITPPSKSCDMYALGATIYDLYLLTKTPMIDEIKNFIRVLCDVNPRNRLTSQNALNYWNSIEKLLVPSEANLLLSFQQHKKAQSENTAAPGITTTTTQPSGDPSVKRHSHNSNFIG